MIDIAKHIKDVAQGKTTVKHRRSSKWRGVRGEHLIVNPYCAVCESKKKLEVHHLVPFHVDPSLELVPSNLATLCEHGRFKGINCHLLIGHLGSYRRTNLDVLKDIAYWNRKLNR